MPYLIFLIDPSLKEENILFVLSFENDTDRTTHTWYYLPKLELEDNNVKIDGRNLFDQPINNDIKIYENIKKLATGQRDDHTTGYLLDYPYFKKKI